MLRHEGEPRFSALALRDVHQSQQHRRLAIEDEIARIDRHVDQRSVGLDMLPRPRHPLLGGLVADPRRRLLESLHVRNFQLLEIAARVTVMRDRGVVDTDDVLVVLGADDHRHRIAVEEQPERGFALLELGDINAQANHAAVTGQPFFDQDAAAIRQHLLVALARMIKFFEALGEPFLLAADGFGIIAAFDAGSQCIAQHGAGLKLVRGPAVYFRVFLVPENIAAVGIEKHDALRKKVDRLTQARVSPLRIRDRGLSLGAFADNFADLGHLAALGQQFWSSLRLTD